MVRTPCGPIPCIRIVICLFLTVATYSIETIQSMIIAWKLERREPLFTTRAILRLPYRYRHLKAPIPAGYTIPCRTKIKCLSCICGDKRNP